MYDPYTHAHPTCVNYRAEFGHSRSNHMGVGGVQKFGGHWPRPLGIWYD